MQEKNEETSSLLMDMLKKQETRYQSTTNYLPSFIFNLLMFFFSLFFSFFLCNNSHWKWNWMSVISGCKQWWYLIFFLFHLLSSEWNNTDHAKQFKDNSNWASFNVASTTLKLKTIAHKSTTTTKKSVLKAKILGLRNYCSQYKASDFTSKYWFFGIN